LTSGQLKRFRHFEQHLRFTYALVNMCELLRLSPTVTVEQRTPKLRQALSNVKLPPFCHLPTCNSPNKAFLCVVNVLVKESRVFKTKARCPSLLLFEAVQHPSQLEDDEFIIAELQEYDETKVISSDEILTTFHFSTLANVVNGSSNDTPSSPEATQQKSGVTVASTTDIFRNDLRLSREIIDMRSGRKPAGFGKLVFERVFGNESSAQEESPENESVAVPTVDSGGLCIQNSTAASVTDPDVPIVVGHETFAESRRRVASFSAHSELSGWSMVGCIAKSNDDIRQEVFVMQLIQVIYNLCSADNVPIYLKPYRIISCSRQTGLVEYVPNAISVDGLKKSDNYSGSLRAHYQKVFGPPSEERYKLAVTEFVRSLAGYSVVCYLLAIKDR
jgi:hypothetical protein